MKARVLGPAGLLLERSAPGCIRRTGALLEYDEESGPCTDRASDRRQALLQGRDSPSRIAGMDVHILRRLPTLEHSSSRGTEGNGPLKSRQPPRRASDHSDSCGAVPNPSWSEIRAREDEKEASFEHRNC